MKKYKKNYYLINLISLLLGIAYLGSLIIAGISKIIRLIQIILNFIIAVLLTLSYLINWLYKLIKSIVKFIKKIGSWLYHNPSVPIGIVCALFVFQINQSVYDFNSTLNYYQSSDRVIIRFYDSKNNLLFNHYPQEKIIPVKVDSLPLSTKRILLQIPHAEFNDSLSISLIKGFTRLATLQANYSLPEIIIAHSIKTGGKWSKKWQIFHQSMIFNISFSPNQKLQFIVNNYYDSHFGYGLETLSQSLFNKNLAKLSKKEVVLLFAYINDHNKSYQTEYVQLSNFRYQDSVKYLQQTNLLTPKETADFKKNSTRLNIYKEYSRAPLASIYILKNFCQVKLLSDSNNLSINTSLNLSLQNWLQEELLQQEMNTHQPLVMAITNTNGQLLALADSQASSSSLTLPFLELLRQKQIFSIPNNFESTSVNKNKCYQPFIKNKTTTAYSQLESADQKYIIYSSSSNKDELSGFLVKVQEFEELDDSSNQMALNSQKLSESNEREVN